MTTTFDHNRFESLKGFELGIYYVKWAEQHTVGQDFFDYFRRKADTFDDEHLECALGILAKTSSIEAFHEIAKYMRHPCASVRLFAANTISHLPLIDEIIMPYVVSTLTNPVDSLGIRELRIALEHPSNAAAKTIAQGYLTDEKKQ